MKTKSYNQVRTEKSEKKLSKQFRKDRKVSRGKIWS